MTQLKTQAITKITAIIGALILLLGAAFHLSALPQVRDALAGGDMAGFFRSALAGMWMLPALHWIFIASLSVGLSRYKSNSCAAILMAFGVLIIVDGVVTFLHVGPFMGAYMLCLAGGLLTVSGVTLRRQMRVS